MSQRRLKGRYELQSTLGRGLATTTHLALDHATGERCVVKLLSLASADALQAHELLTREARALLRLDHPRIPRLVDFFSEEDGPETRVCLVQQYVEGQSLLDRVRAGGRCSEAETIALGVKLARVLEYLHGFEPPILHRDVKPANVLVTAGERVYLVDFGAVRDHLPQEMLHPSGPSIVGTRGYMPLEQFEGHAVPGSDLYALGATLLFAVSGKQPSGLGKQGLRLAIEPGIPISSGFASLLARMLEPDWRERPLSASEVREALERLELHARRARPRSRPWVAALAMLLAVAGLGIAWHLKSGASERRAGANGSQRQPAELAPAPGRQEATPLAASRAPVQEPQFYALEQEPQPPEALPEGRDVASLVSVEQRSGFTVYRFGGPLARAQPLDLALGMGAVWVGTSLGLLRHDPRTGSWRQWDETAGLSGERLNEIAVAAGRVFVDASTSTGPGTSRGVGVFAFEIAGRRWTRVTDVGRVWDLWGDGSTLWLGRGDGAQARDLATGAERRFTRAAGELVHDTVHAVRRHGELVAFAALGDYVEQTKDFVGGGVTLWDRQRGEFRSYTEQHGLARGYCSDVFLDDRDVFVTHWDEERGLSRIDPRTGTIEALRQSANGIDLGGVVLAGEPDTLWIGQQGALVRLDRASRQATALRERDGLPGYIVSAIAIGEDAVWASLYAYGQGSVRTAGLVCFPRQ